MTGRIVDVKGALETLPYPDGVSGTVTFQTKDPLADWNSGIFTLTVAKGVGKVTSTPQPQPEATMPIGTLALLAFGAVDVNDLVFCEKIEGTDKALQTLQTLFPTTKCYINEWY